MNENMDNIMEVETIEAPAEETTIDLVPVQEEDYIPEESGMSTGAAMLLGGGIAVGTIVVGKLIKKKFKKSKLWHKIKDKIDEPDEEEELEVIDADVVEDDDDET